MSCKLERPSQQALFDRVKDMFSSTVLGGAPVIPESNEWYAVSLNYAMAEEFYAISEQSWRESDPRYACCDNLVDLAERDGVYPRPASPAQGYIRIIGTAGASLPQNMVFTFGGQNYVPASTIPGAMPDAGELIIRVQAVVPGSAGNISGQVTGQIQTPPPGVDAEVSLYGGRFCDGAEAEGCEPFRARYLERLAYKRNYGIDWIKQKVLEWPCVTDVCERAGVCCDIPLEDYGKNVKCNAEVKLYAIFDGTFPCGMAPECITDEITEWIFGIQQGTGQGQAEWGMFGKIYTATPAYVRVVVDGLACASPSATQEINRRVRDFVTRLCPSTTLSIDDLNSIIKQILGSGIEFSAAIEVIDPEDDNVRINSCGDAEPQCDVRVCLGEDVLFIGMTAVTAGLCV